MGSGACRQLGQPHMLQGLWPFADIADDRDWLSHLAEHAKIFQGS